MRETENYVPRGKGAAAAPEGSVFLCMRGQSEVQQMLRRMIYDAVEVVSHAYKEGELRAATRTVGREGERYRGEPRNVEM